VTSAMLASPGPFVPIPGAAVSEFGSRSWSRAPDGRNIEGTIERANGRGGTERRLPALLRHRLQVGPQGRADVPVDTGMPGTSWPVRWDRSRLGTLTSSIQVRWPRRKPCGVSLARIWQRAARSISRDQPFRRGATGGWGDEMAGDLRCKDGSIR
jgi:hypothetical protein